MNVHQAINQVIAKEPLFANMVTRLKLIEDNYNCPTMGTDGEHLFYNTEFLKTLKDDEMCGVVLHEVLHCAFRHQWRRGDREPMKWNIATDYAINTIVTESFPLPKDSLLDTKYYGMSAEEIYNTLPEPKKFKFPFGGKGKGQGKGSGSSQEGEKGSTKQKNSSGNDDGDQEQGWCDKTPWEGQGKNGEKQGIMDKIRGRVRPKGAMTEKEREAMWKKLYEQTFLRNYGKLPQSIQRVLEKAHYVPVIDWASLVQNLLSDDVNDYTFSIPDRRFLGDDFILPSMYSTDNLKDVIFAYDTSGSISNADLKAYYEETMSLFSNFTSLTGWLAFCDAYLHKFVELDTQRAKQEFKFVGGGGTSFEPVFDEIEERGLRPKALFYFTDCAGYFPNKEPEFPVFWLVRTQIGEKWPIDVPYGTVIRFLG